MAVLWAARRSHRPMVTPRAWLSPPVKQSEIRFEPKKDRAAVLAYSQVLLPSNLSCRHSLVVYSVHAVETVYTTQIRVSSERWSRSEDAERRERTYRPRGQPAPRRAYDVRYQRILVVRFRTWSSLLRCQSWKSTCALRKLEQLADLELRRRDPLATVMATSNQSTRGTSSR